MSGGELKHYGMPRRSGRYPWGSGENPYQRSVGWRAHIQNLKDQGFTEKEIADAEGITINQLRIRNTISKDEVRAANRAEVIRLSEHGYSNMEIGRRMGINESTVRSLKNPVLAERANITRNVANILKENVDEKQFIDVGAGVENYMGVKRPRFNTAIAQLEEMGYKIHNVNVEQAGMPGQFTTFKVLGAPDTEWVDVVRDASKIKNITAVSDDYGRSFKSVLGLEPIKSIDSKRLEVRYHGEGGDQKDGIMELRRGVKDLDMGGAQYAQVRIGVDDTHFLKGMAVYSDNMPKGTDVIFYTNKHRGGDKLDALKKMKTVLDDSGKRVIDKDNPFGSTIKEGGQRGSLNIVNEEGDWETWSKTLSSQVLSKQPVKLAKQQLDLGLQAKKEEYNEIMRLTNPVIKKQLLLAFADDCDSSSVHLKAAGLPRQASKVILPIPELKEKEIYAPTFKNGERVALIRHPHGGVFEIPEVVVNNKSKAAQNIMKNAPDAIGINPKIAAQLSGADFDGDTVIVVPNNNSAIRTSAPLEALRNFDPIEAYPGYEGMTPIKTQTRQTKMGEVSNLITDMTIKGASLPEIAQAVKHSMVVIDSEKHNLNYKQSYIDNRIAALSERYQGSKRGGASTIISRAKSSVRVPHRLERPIDPTTGKKVYEYTGESYVNKDGKTIERTVKSTRMAEATDARELSSGRQIEEAYAGYANELKALANTSRKNALATKPIPYSPSARKAYQGEVDSLDRQLDIAVRNKPLERQAQVIAQSVVRRKREANPDMDKDDIKKVRNQALAEARVRTGAGKNRIKISDREWEAIQAGAISSSKLSEILQNADLDQVKQLATPRDTIAMTPANLSRAKSMLNSGLTQAEVADALGVSTSTLSKALN